ncbi:SIS domain-containing protein [Leucobacter ruminantium]|uniref:SIS domain-containing protein n=1 Tax=Leucobacter ruminantium TaxID=1289170 RepID=A0A939LZ75_9MICO|nr:SIS domain-containing protein [Leucobacter ruminantium]MBO1805127.1 SIS domain-containing protein [Leucobacter ruminantium]
MLGFDADLYQRVIGGAGALRSQIDAIVDEVAATGYDSIFLIGSGGSYAAMWPYEHLMTRLSTVPVRSAIAAELVLTGDPRLTERSIAIFSSLSGTTKETVAALEYCRERGVTTIALTGYADSPIAVADHVLVNWADDETASESVDIQLLLLTTALLHRRGEFDDYERLANELADLTSVLTRVQEQADPIAEAFAKKHVETDYHFLVGTGMLWGFTYNYSMCILEEMQWLRTTRVHGAEFFHGSLELIDRDTSLLLFVGEDETRPLMDRVLRFAETYNDDTTVVDTADYPLDGISPEFREFVGPIVVDAITIRFSKHLEAARRHDLTTRRYYRKVEY